MRLNEVSYSDGRPIDGYGPGFFRIGGQVYQGAIIAHPGGVLTWGGFDDAQTLVELAPLIDVIFVGTGAEVSHLPPVFCEVLEQAGIGIEPMASPTACRTYNVLLSEGRRIAAALIPV
tara:strand:- start:17935 stop:18288 length:354 start_codon:yes stop_codon:yes gene_type:complete